MRQDRYRLSVVIPVLDEEECVKPLLERLTEVLDTLTDDYEVVFVDDCSTDGTLERIEAAAARDPRIKCLSLSRTRGHQVALSCGLEAATGDAVISMDGDLQHPPAVIPEMVRLWQEGYDVVNSVRNNSGDNGRIKPLLSRLFYFAFNRIADIPLTPNSSDFRLLDRRCVDALNEMGEYFKFHRGLVYHIGFQQAEVRFDCPPRFAGRPAYNLRRSLKLASNGIFSFSTLPLKVPFYLGAAVLAFTSVLFLVCLVLFLTGAYKFAPGWTSVVALVLVTFGVQLLFMGVVGLYVSKIFIETKRRPAYFVQDSIGFEAPRSLRRPPAPARSAAVPTPAASAAAAQAPPAAAAAPAAARAWAASSAAPSTPR